MAKSKRIPEPGDIEIDFDFVIPAAFQDDGQTKYFLEKQFERALKSYGTIDFSISERDDGFNTIIGRGSFTCPPGKVDDIAIDLALVSVHWRRSILTMAGRTIWDGNQKFHGVPMIVLENFERYLSLTGRRLP